MKVGVEVVGDPAGGQAAFRALSASAIAFGDNVAAVAERTSEATAGQIARLRELQAAYEQVAATATEDSDLQVAAANHAADAQRRLAAITRTTGAAGAEAAAATGVSSTRALQSLTNIGRGMSTYVTAPVLLAGAASLKLGLDFEQSMELLHTQAGASQGETDALSGSILNLVKSGQSFAQTAGDMAQGAFYIESSGIRGQAAIEALRVSAAGAAVGQTSLANTSNVLTSALKVYGAAAGSDAQVMATLNAAVGQGKMHMEDLEGALSTKLLPTAKAIGVTLPQALSAIDVFTQAGVPAEAAATNLTQALIRMEAPTKAGKAALAQLGITGGQLADALAHGGLPAALKDVSAGYEQLVAAGQKNAANQAVFSAFGGTKGGGAMLTLVQQYGSYMTTLDRNQKQANPATFWADVASEMHQPNEKIHQSLASLGADFITIGEDIAPVVAEIANGATKMADAFSHLPGPVKDGLGAIVIGLAIGGPIMLAGVGVVKMVNSIGDAFKWVASKAATSTASADGELATTGAAASGTAGEVESIGAAAQTSATEMTQLGTAAGVTAGEVTADTAVMDADLAGVGTAAATAGTEIEVGIGAGAGTAATEVTAATAIMDADLAGVGAAAVAAGAEVTTLGGLLAGIGGGITGFFSDVGAGLLAGGAGLVAGAVAVTTAVLATSGDDPTNGTPGSGNGAALAKLIASGQIGQKELEKVAKDTGLSGETLGTDLHNKKFVAELTAYAKDKGLPMNVGGPTGLQGAEGKPKKSGLSGLQGPDGTPTGPTPKVATAPAQPLTKAQQLQVGLETNPDDAKLLHQQIGADQAELAWLEKRRAAGKLSNTAYVADVGPLHQEINADQTRLAAAASKAHTAASQAHTAHLQGVTTKILTLQTALENASKRADAFLKPGSTLDGKKVSSSAGGGTAAAERLEAFYVKESHDTGLSSTERARYGLDASKLAASIAKHRIDETKKFESKKDAFTVPLRLQLAAAKAGSTADPGDDLAAARQIKAYAEKAIAAGKLTWQGMIDAYNTIAQQNAVLGTGAIAANSHVVSASKLATELGLHGAAKKHAEELLAQAMAHGGHIPNGQGVQGVMALAGATRVAPHDVGQGVSGRGGGGVNIENLHLPGVHDVHSFLNELQGLARHNPIQSSGPNAGRGLIG